MPLSHEKLSDLCRGIQHALISTSLNEYDRKFLRDMQAKLNRFGPQTRLSQKQYQRLMRLTGAGRLQALARRRDPRRRRRTFVTPDWRQITGGLVFATFAAGVLAFKATERFPEYVRPAVSLTATETVTGRVTHVRDGDTIEVSGVPIRFGSLDCAERDTAEGQRATAKMRGLVVGEQLTCHLNGRTSYDRKIGSCQLRDGRDLAAVMIREGYCGRYW